MTEDKYKDFLADSPKHIAALKTALSRFENNLGETHYKIVSLAFPLDEWVENPPFSIPKIDHDKFLPWIENLGWSVSLEQIPGQPLPKICFKRLV